MDDAALVRGLERVGELAGDREGLRNRERAIRSGSAATDGGRIFSATSRLSFVSCAR